MKKSKIAFLVSGSGGTLKFLYYAIKTASVAESANIDFEITSVISDRDCGALEFARAKNINTKPINYSQKNDDELVEILSNIDADIIVTNIHKILTKKVLNSTKADFVNLHYSLLPAFGGMIGMKTVDAARQNNCQFIGATVHDVNEELDGGNIICQSCIPTDWSEKTEDIYDKVFRSACIAFLNGLIIKCSNGELKTFNSNQYLINPSLKYSTDNFDENFWTKIKE